jgi:hypothetical protein
VESDLDVELRFHRDQQLQSYARAGLSPDEARRRLGIEFGGLEQTKKLTARREVFRSSNT